MNPVKKAILKRLKALPSEFAPIRDHCVKYLKYCSAIDDVGKDPVLLIGHQPWIGPEAYRVIIFPPAKQTWFTKYSRIHHVKFPSLIQILLRQMNGCFIHNFDLFGMPFSMLQNPPGLDRSKLQCLDIGTADQLWSAEYLGAESQFHFGSRAYSYSENVGYFLDKDGTIRALRKSGRTVGEWSELKSFFRDELAASEKVEEKVPHQWWSRRWD